MASGYPTGQGRTTTLFPDSWTSVLPVLQPASFHLSENHRPTHLTLSQRSDWEKLQMQKNSRQILTKHSQLKALFLHW